MSRVIKMTIVLGAVCATVVAYYSVLPKPILADTSGKTYHYKLLKGVLERPDDPKLLGGHYYRGDGTGFNVYLTLSPDGTYKAEWHGCLGSYGEAAGKWKLGGGMVVFTPSKETDMMRNELRGLEVSRFQGHWILLSTNQSDRKFYDKWGISAYSCFQNTNSIFPGP